MDPKFYDEDYFIRGKESGKSLYTDYRWLPDLTIPMVKAIALHLDMSRGDTVLDFGCARGYMVKAFEQIGYKAEGYDPSDWVITHCDPEVADKLRSYLFNGSDYHWIIAKDVLEHLTIDELREAITTFSAMTTKGIFVVVPLSPKYGQPYIVPEYEQDVTHVIRMPLEDWHATLTYLLGDGWAVTATNRVAGVKDNYYETHPLGNGFITALRCK